MSWSFSIVGGGASWRSFRSGAPEPGKWYTGEMLRYVHMGYASVYETDIFLEFEKGVLINKRVVDNRELED